MALAMLSVAKFAFALVGVHDVLVWYAQAASRDECDFGWSAAYDEPPIETVNHGLLRVAAPFDDAVREP